MTDTSNMTPCRLCICLTPQSDNPMVEIFFHMVADSFLVYYSTKTVTQSEAWTAFAMSKVCPLARNAMGEQGF